MMREKTMGDWRRGGVSAVLAGVVVLAAGATGPARGENWPQWRGPAFNGSTTETHLPASFSQTENVAWSVRMPGPSGSTPVIWGDRLFVSSVNSANGALVALCLEAATGKVLWQKPTGKDRPANQNNMASPSPITDGKAVYFFYGTGELFAFDLDGKDLWSRDLEKDHGRCALMFGYSSSPLLWQGKLYVVAIRNQRANAYGGGGGGGAAAAGKSDSYLLAIDPATGKDLWKHVRPMAARDEAQEAYTTAVPFERDGKSAILTLGADALTAHDPQDGHELWRWEGYNTQRVNHWRIIPSPVVAGEIIFVPGPKHSKGFAIRPAAVDRLPAEPVAWTFDREIPDASTPLFYQGKLYVLNDDGRLLSCLNPADGKVIWQGKVPVDGVIRASLSGADGKLYIISETGEAAVLAAGEEFKVLHKVRMASGGRSRSTIVPAAGSLYIRTPETLYCIRAAKP
jgi:outer membrane protein assembly factor BamB